MATINEKGIKYNWTAVADENLVYNMLSRKPILKIEEIGKFIEGALKDSDISAVQRKEVILMESCLFKLQAVLYHLHRMKGYKANLFSKIKKECKNKDVSGLTMGFLEKELVFEFEALLLQARACLDALTILVTNKLGQRTNRFTKLKNVIENFKMKDSAAKNVFELISESEWLIDSGVLTGESPTRSYVAHLGSLLTVQQCCITVSGLKSDRVLLFDMEFRSSIPVMNTSSKILEYVPYFVINVLSIICELALLEKKEFVNDLGNEFVVLSKESVKPKKGVKVGIIKEMNRVNFIIGDEYVSKAVLSKALRIKKIKTN